MVGNTPLGLLHQRVPRLVPKLQGQVGLAQAVNEHRVRNNRVAPLGVSR